MTFDSFKGNHVVVHHVSMESDHGLYFADLIGTGFLFRRNTGIVHNSDKFSSHNYSKATLARKI